MRQAVRDLAVVLGVSWLVRAVVIATWPSSAHSSDLDSWRVVATALARHENPYVVTDIVKWPPFALIWVWLVDHVAIHAHVSFFLVMRLSLIAAESVLVVVLYLLLTRYAPPSRVKWLLLVGISLDPIAILFVCQHENIDVFLALWVAVALWALAAYDRTRAVEPWLAACLALGLGAFTKTIPLILAPLLAAGFRAASGLGRALGVALFLGPAALSVAVAFVLAPRDVWDNVFLYRSIPGYFGVTGLLDAGGLRGAHAYEILFTVALALAVVGLFVAAWRNAPTYPETALLAALLLAAVPSIGPGYAPQYGYWWLPPLLVTYVLLDDGWRRILAGFYVVAALTYVWDYAFVLGLGRFVVGFFDGSGFLHRLSARVSTPTEQTLIRLPLFAAFVVLLVAGFRRLRFLHSVSVPP